MKLTKEDLINAQISRADEAFKMAELAIEAKLWNSAASELYYNCFYLIQALFLATDINVKTHNGAKTLFSQHFIKKRLVDDQYGKLFAKLFNYRQDGDYGNYMLTSGIDSSICIRSKKI